MAEEENSHEFEQIQVQALDKARKLIHDERNRVESGYAQFVDGSPNQYRFDAGTAEKPNEKNRDRFTFLHQQMVSVNKTSVIVSANKDTVNGIGLIATAIGMKDDELPQEEHNAINAIIQFLGQNGSKAAFIKDIFSLSDNEQDAI